MTTTFLETAAVAPPPVPGESQVVLPLTFLDFIWLPFIPIRRLLFYRCDCSKSHFLATLVPQLKHSLSLTLRHYLPVAGNLLYPINAAHDDFDHDAVKPFFRYLPGDSVPLTVAESAGDFDHLIANHQRDADQFYDFMPQMPPITQQGEYKLVPILALQVTLFPDRGICIGFANHHSLGDASSIVRFMSTWAEINRFGRDHFLTSSASLPIFDRSVINDPLGIDSIFWKTMRKIPLQASSFPLPTGRVRATYTLHPSQIKQLKNLVLGKNPGLSQVSSFVVTAAYTWTCLLRSGDAVGEAVDESVAEHFVYTVDVRGRVNPPVPANYFGNGLSYGMAKLEHRELVKGDDEEGFATAAKAIAEDIKRVNNKDEVLKGADKWMSEWEKYAGMRVLGVSGSPRFDLCGADFGWGRARKLEVVSIDGEKYSMSLCRSGAGDSEGVLEIGLSLPKDRMEAFATIFAQGLNLST